MGHIKPTVFLIKEDVTNFDDVFKDSSGLDKRPHENGAFLYYKSSNPHSPDWLPYLQENFQVNPNSFCNSSSYAVLVLRASNRLFAIPLGMGSHLIDIAKIEYNFGIKVAINSIPNIRQMDLTTPENYSQKTKKQSMKDSTPEEMGVNKQKDILRGLAGKLPKDHALGKSIEGKDSVRVTKNIETLNELVALCEMLLTCSEEESYKEHYPWIDNMALINDPVLIDVLYEDLIVAIKARGFDHMFISTPVLVEDFFKYDGFVFKGNRERNKVAYPFPDMSDLVNDLGDDFINSLDLDKLKKTCKVYLREVGEGDCFGWPLSRCIVWETEKNGGKYILSEGDWYKINDNFYQEVCDFFDGYVVDDIRLPDAEDGYGKESDYNRIACDLNEHYYLFDLGHEDARGKHIGKNRNEICDIFDAHNKRFIHVKEGKASPDIHHLLRQGAHSAVLLLKEIADRNKFRRYLVEYGLDDSIIGEPYLPPEYTVSYVLILGDTQRQDIPFFSKVSFKDAVEASIGMMRYKCEFGYVTKIAEQDVQAEEINEAA